LADPPGNLFLLNFLGSL